ncbi:PDZ domain-containing protein [Marilutibacter alkalisoli]|uniref:PDZ domain-containing protein n=1 Tax=Marilutibacter alkalisoli TaxID=2591633 RepID=A0A514BPP9_9GAMM|nr:PDZ domain-containing protein [Lysobacter alkalisoli]QDH69350.1 PDZ domain-containing protein [Lysobacter alkalisoli]
MAALRTIAMALLLAFLPLPALATGGNPLDVVVDVRRPHTEGVTVMAVTPGGNGERIGLRVGDRIIEANGRSLTDTLKPSRMLAEATSGGDSLRLRVIRDGQTLILDGSVVEAAAPAVEGCGYISTLGTLPHVRDKLYPVVIVDIDGTGTPLEANRHRLPAGLHVVVVNERIGGIRFNEMLRRQRDRMQVREGARAGKALLVDVQPGKRYLLGARFLDDNLGVRTISDNAYWEPLVWKVVDEDCR